MLKIESKSNWIAENNKHLSNSFKIVEDEINVDENFPEILCEEQSISLRQPKKPCEPFLCEEFCTITVSLVPKEQDALQFSQENLEECSKLLKPMYGNYVKEMTILSEAKFIELYDATDSQYVETVQSELISNFEDSRLYKAKLVLPVPKKSIILKLKGLYIENCVWIYGVFIKICDKSENVSHSLHKIANLDLNVKSAANLTPNIKNPSLNQMNNFTLLINMMKQFESMKELTNQNFTKDKNKADKSSLKINHEISLAPSNHTENTSINNDKFPLDSQIQSQSRIKTEHVFTNERQSSLSLDNECAINYASTLLDSKLKSLEDRVYQRLENKILESKAEIMSKLQHIENLITASKPT